MYVFMYVCLQVEKLVIFRLQLCPIIAEGLESFGGEKFVFASWNKLIILLGDLKCILLIIFLIQNLISSDNVIPCDVNEYGIQRIG